MTYKDIPRLLTMTIVWLLLLVWYLNAYRIGCLPALGLTVLFTAVLAMSGTELLLARRRRYLRECLEPGGQLYRWLRRRVVLLALELAKSAALAVLLLVGTLAFAPRQWSLIFADVLLIGLLLPRLYTALEGQIRPEYRFVIARRWAMWVSVALLWLESMTGLFFLASDNFIGLRWQEVVAYAASGPEVQCQPFAGMVSVGAAIQSLGQWSVQNLVRNLNDLPQALVAAIGLMAAAAASLLLAYACSRAFIGTVARPWVFWRISPQIADATAAPQGSVRSYPDLGDTAQAQGSAD